MNAPRGYSERVVGEAAQERFGARLADAVEGALTIHLLGDLGAGKTTLVRGFLRRAGHRGAVKSPTYTLIEPYEVAGRKVYHLDLYRVADPDELEYLGLREMLAEDAVLLIEWPQRGEGWLPAPDLTVSIAHREGAREVALSGHSQRGGNVVRRLQVHL